MKNLAIALIFASLATVGSAQSLVSAYDFNNNLNKVYDRDGFAQALEHRQGGSTNASGVGLTYSAETVGGMIKQVANFSNSPADFFRAQHGMAPNGGPAADYVNQYSIVMDMKFTSSGWSSFYNTTATNANDGDAFVNPTNGVGISSDYTGTFARNEWNRVVISVNTPSVGVQGMSIYLNGALANTIPITGFEGRWALYAHNDANFQHVDILADNNGDSGAGQISQLGFYDSALTADEVSQLGRVGSSLIPVPEPATLIVVGLGLAGLLRRKQK